MDQEHPHHCPLDRHTFRPLTIVRELHVLTHVFYCTRCPKLKTVTVLR